MNKRRLAVVGLGAALVVGLAAPTWAGSPPAPSPDAVIAVARLSEPKVPEEMLGAMKRDLGLSSAAARERLTFQAGAAEVEHALEDQLGDDYAGAWLDPTTSVLHVGVTDPAAAAGVLEAGAHPVEVAHSLAELDAWKVAVDGALGDVASVVPSWYIDVTTNSVLVNAQPGAVEQVRELVLAAGVPADAVQVVATDVTVGLAANVIGGNAYYIGSNARCSVGFAVVGGFVTAGHCGAAGATTASPAGTFAGSSFPGNDYALVQVTSGDTPIAAVNNYAGSAVAVAGSTEAPVGATVCRSGSTTGWHCGTILGFNATVNYSEGAVYGQILSNVCLDHGDSGGSLLAGDQAQGVTSGGSLPMGCPSQVSNNRSYFQPVNEALSVYGLKLLTASGAAPSRCAGFPAMYSGTVAAGAVVARPSPGSRPVYVSSSGTIKLCLSGPTGVDLDLHLQKWNTSTSAWVYVAAARTTSNNETLSYSATAGHYRFVIQGYSGGGAYSLGVSTP